MVSIEQERFMNANPYYAYDHVDSIKKFGASGDSVFDYSGNGNHGTVGPVFVFDKALTPEQVQSADLVTHEKPKVIDKEFWEDRDLPTPIVCETFHEGN